MGNGRATALAAARHGAAVVVTDIDGGAAQATAAMVGETGVAGYALTSDAADPDACETAVTWAVDVLGGLDALVLNVGIGLGRGLQGTSLSDWNTVFDVNLRSNFLTLKAALPLMDEGSSTVLISSVAGLRPGSGIPTYDASKAAQLGLMRQAAREAAAARRSGQRGRARAHRHTPRTTGDGGTAKPRQDPRPAGPPGHRIGGRRRRRLPTFRRSELHHRPDPGR